MQKVYNSLSLEDGLVFLSRDNFNKVNFKGIGDVFFALPILFLFGLSRKK